MSPGGVRAGAPFAQRRGLVCGCGEWLARGYVGLGKPAEHGSTWYQQRRSPSRVDSPYPLLRTVRKCNRQSETYQTLEDYGDLWLKMFGASVVCGENFGVHERPLRKWRFFRCSGYQGGCRGGLPPPPVFKLWISSRKGWSFCHHLSTTNLWFYNVW